MTVDRGALDFLGWLPGEDFSWPTSRRIYCMDGHPSVPPGPLVAMARGYDENLTATTGSTKTLSIDGSLSAAQATLSNTSPWEMTVMLHRWMCASNYGLNSPGVVGHVLAEATHIVSVHRYSIGAPAPAYSAVSRSNVGLDYKFDYFRYYPDSNSFMGYSAVSTFTIPPGGAVKIFESAGISADYSPSEGVVSANLGAGFLAYGVATPDLA